MTNYFTDPLLTLFKLSLLFGPLIAAFLTGDLLTSDVTSTAASGNEFLVVLMSVWLVFMARAFGLNEITSAYGLEANTYIFIMAIGKTLMLTDVTLSQLGSLKFLFWLIPIIANVVYDVVYAANPKLLDGEAESTHDLDAPHLNVFWLVVLTIGTLAYNTARFFLFLYDPISGSFYNHEGTNYALYTIVDGAVGILLCLRLNQMQTKPDTEAWKGTGLVYPLYLLYTLVIIPTGNVSFLYLIVAFGGAWLLLCVSVFTGVHENENKWAAALAAPFLCAWILVKNIYHQDKWLRLFYLVGATYIFFTVYEASAWYTTHLTFDGRVRTVAADVVTLVEGGTTVTPFTYTRPDGSTITSTQTVQTIPYSVKQFFDDTNDPTIYGALETVGAASVAVAFRNALRSFLSFAYPALYIAYYGLTATVTPGKDLVIVLTLLGPLLVAVFVALQVFPSVERVVSSSAFWSTAMLLTALNLLLTHTLPDAQVTLWYLVIPGLTSLSRTYSSAGSAVLAMQCTMFVICFICALRTLHVEMYGDSNSGFSGAAATKAIGRTVERVFSPSFFCLIAGGILLFMAVTAGSPFQSFSIGRTSSYVMSHPPWAAVTTLDYLGAASFNPYVDAVIGIGVEIQNAMPDGCFAGVCVHTLISGLTHFVTDIVGGVVNTLVSNLPGSVANLFSFMTKLENIIIENVNVMNFDLLNLQNLKLGLALPTLQYGIPLFDINVNLGAWFSTPWVLYLFAGIGALFALAIVLSPLVDSVIPIMEPIKRSLYSLIFGAMMSLFLFFWQAAQVLTTYNYQVNLAFNSNAWLYIAAALFILASAVLSSFASDANASGSRKQEAGDAYAYRPILTTTKRPLSHVYKHRIV